MENNCELLTEGVERVECVELDGVVIEGVVEGVVSAAMVVLSASVTTT